MSICVLLVEHDERVLHQLGRGLRDAGFMVMPLGDAEQAIDLLCLVAFDLVLADTGTLRYAGAGGAAFYSDRTGPRSIQYDALGRGGLR